MTTKRKKQEAAEISSKEELLEALRPLKSIKWINNLIKKLEQPQTNMLQGKNADTEKLILALCVSLLLYEKNKERLMREGALLKKYMKKYATQVPVTEASFITDKLNELIFNNTDNAQSNTHNVRPKK